MLWSLSTTVRNSQRIFGFLQAAQRFNGFVWDNKNQGNYFKELIRSRLYGYNQSQFLNGLPQNLINLISNLNYQLTNQDINSVLFYKAYVNPGIDGRGRTALAPLKKLGLIRTDNNILSITPKGTRYLNGNDSYQDMLIGGLCKWEYPNPDSTSFTVGYNIKPFVATVHLYDYLYNNHNNFNGFTEEEFGKLILSFTDYNNFNNLASNCISYFNGVYNLSTIAHLHRNFDAAQDYANNIFKYFSDTGIFFINYQGKLELQQNHNLLTSILSISGFSNHYSSLTTYFNYIGA